MQMYDFVCVSACEYEMPVGSVTKHNVAVLIPASRAPLTLLPLSLSFLLDLPLYNNNIPKIHHNLC